VAHTGANVGETLPSDDNQTMSERRDEVVDGLLEPAHTAAHRALVRLDDDDVPAALRSVRAASKKRTLPRPFRRVLAAHLEEAWLRDLAVAELANGDSPADQASRAFLTRPDGWQQHIEALAQQQEERQGRLDLVSVEAEKRRLEEVNDELSRRLREADARIQDVEQHLGSDERLEGLRNRVEAANRTIARLESEIGNRSTEVARLRAELDEADERIGVLRAKAARTTDAAREGKEGHRAFGRGRPVDTARFLDELVETMRPQPGTVEAGVEVPPLALPRGIRPDSDEAIDWIRTVERRVLVVVDGHNVAHDLDSEPGRTARDRVVSEVARLRRLSDGPVSAIVFFDTGTDAEAHSNFGVAVRYVEDADSAIESVVAAADVDCIVISTDKGVRERTAVHGALTLWGTALSDWIMRR
ncbi:MAG: hypothetical protein WD990_06445, partial [Acidimicrobiia bacterium]